MTPILHHFDASPFAEKIRLVFGIKALDWQAVETPLVVRKPKLMQLTGGYRKTPVLQIGADIYCDTRRIALELEHRYPEPSLFDGCSPALCDALSAWSDEWFFRPGAALSMDTSTEVPDALQTYRRAVSGFLNFDSLKQDIPHFFAQFQAQLILVNGMLEHGMPYLFGAKPGWADVLAYFPLWMGRSTVVGIDELVAPLAALRAWEERMARIGYGRSKPVSADRALEVAAAHAPVSPPGINGNLWPFDMALGDPVCVRPRDYTDVPVHGTLLSLTLDGIAIRRESPDLGEIVVHFPRIGYDLRHADEPRQLTPTSRDDSGANVQLASEPS